MTEKFKFDEFDVKLAIKYAKEYIQDLYTDSLEAVIMAAFSDLRNLPTLRMKESTTIVFKEYVEKWTKAYFKAYNNRPSQRTGNKSATFSDPIIGTILGARIPKIQKDLNKLEAAHSMMMTIENIVGDLLEEYLCEKLSEDGWHCCWGSTIDAVDFCKKTGELLQVKNSDNSENSSSSRVRNGTTIKKWHRRKSTGLNKYNWDALNEITGRDDLCEEDFEEFVQDTIENNGACIFVDPTNPLTK